jgi:hypothetical protein
MNKKVVLSKENKIDKPLANLIKMRGEYSN